MSRYYNRGNNRRTEKKRCDINFDRDINFEQYKKIKGIKLDAAPFYLQKTPGNYYEIYTENKKKYKDCTEKYHTKKYNYQSNKYCDNLNTETEKSKKELLKSLSEYAKRKTLKRVSKNKTKERLDSLACYMKLLDNLLSQCGNNQNNKHFIDVLKEKLKTQVQEKDKDDAENYIKYLFESNNDVANSDTFKKWDSNFRKQLNQIIDTNYKTCS